MTTRRKLRFILVCGAVLWIVCAAILEVSLWYPPAWISSMSIANGLRCLVLVILVCYAGISILWCGKECSNAIIKGDEEILPFVFKSGVVMLMVNLVLLIILTFVYDHLVLRLHYDSPVGQFDVGDLGLTIWYPGDEHERTFELPWKTLGGETGIEEGPAEFVIADVTGPIPKELKVGGRLEAIVQSENLPEKITVSGYWHRPAYVRAKVRVPPMDINSPTEITGHLSRINVAYGLLDDFNTYVVRNRTTDTKDVTLKVFPEMVRSDFVEARERFSSGTALGFRAAYFYSYYIGLGLGAAIIHWRSTKK